MGAVCEFERIVGQVGQIFLAECWLYVGILARFWPMLGECWLYAVLGGQGPLCFALGGKGGWS